MFTLQDNIHVLPMISLLSCAPICSSCVVQFTDSTYTSRVATCTANMYFPHAYTMYSSCSACTSHRVNPMLPVRYNL